MQSHSDSAPVSCLSKEERRRVRNEVARIFAPLESDLLDAINEIRGARGLHQFDSLDSARMGAE